MPDPATTQDEVIAFLADPASYGDDAVERIDTHISLVFLTGDRAYKLKRAVRFSYLDFSTREKRAEACRREVLLNRRAAPELYLGVRAITREADGSLAFDGAGVSLDHVVVMRRFEQATLFDRLAERGALTDELLEGLALEIARFHGAAEKTPGFGGRTSLEIEIAGNADNLALAGEEVLSPAACAQLRRQWDTALERTAALLDERDRTGHVRRCHGDLHLRNIFLWGGRPTLFDGIEFSDHLACIDVLYDLAFLVMDLVHRGLAAGANRVFNTYLDATDESGGLPALGLMLSLRAAVRAHTGAAAARVQSDGERRRATLAEAAAYAVLAGRFLEERPPQLVAIGGLSGSGKSTVARALAVGLGRSPGARVVHTDALRKRMHGVANSVRLPTEAYASEVSARVYHRQREEAARCLAAGFTVVADGVFANPAERAAIAAVVRDTGAQFVGLWLDAPAGILRERIAGRRGDMSDADDTVLDLQLTHGAGPIDWRRIDAARSLAAIVEDARSAVAADHSKIVG